MIPINNSDLAWLIVTDYNQDNNIGFPEELRQDIISPDVNDWHHEEDRTNTQLGPVLGDAVGHNSHGVGCPDTHKPPNVGGYILRVVFHIRAPISGYVGGHRNLELLG